MGILSTLKKAGKGMWKMVSVALTLATFARMVRRLRGGSSRRSRRRRN